MSLLNQLFNRGILGAKWSVVFPFSLILLFLSFTFLLIARKPRKTNGWNSVFLVFRKWKNSSKPTQILVLGLVELRFLFSEFQSSGRSKVENFCLFSVPTFFLETEWNCIWWRRFKNLICGFSFYYSSISVIC